MINYIYDTNKFRLFCFSGIKGGLMDKIEAKLAFDIGTNFYGTCRRLSVIECYICGH